MRSGLSIAALWSPAGKGLASWVLYVTFHFVSVPFPCGILGQVWYLIVSILDVCLLTYFNPFNQFKPNGISHRYQFEQSISVLRDVGGIFYLFKF